MSNSDYQSDRQTLSLYYDSDEAMETAYLPFFDSGGLFFPCDQKSYAFNQLVTLYVALPTLSEPIEVDAMVGWKIPLGSAGWGAEGVGLRFSGHGGEALKRYIEGISKKHSEHMPST